MLENGYKDSPEGFLEFCRVFSFEKRIIVHSSRIGLFEEKGKNPKFYFPVPIYLDFFFKNKFYLQSVDVYLKLLSSHKIFFVLLNRQHRPSLEIHLLELVHHQQFSANFVDHIDNVILMM